MTLKEHFLITASQGTLWCGELFKRRSLDSRGSWLPVIFLPWDERTGWKGEGALFSVSLLLAFRQQQRTSLILASSSPSSCSQGTTPLNSPHPRGSSISRCRQPKMPEHKAVKGPSSSPCSFDNVILASAIPALGGCTQQAASKRALGDPHLLVFTALCNPLS